MTHPPAPTRHRRPRIARPALAAAVALVVAAPACSGDDAPDWLAERAHPTTTTTAPDPTTTTAPAPDEVAAVDLEPGMCIEDADDFTGREANEITDAVLVPCRQPHDAEVYARIDLDAGADRDFPGAGRLRQRAQQGCRGEFEDFVGIRWARSELEIAALWPSPESWAAGDRAIVCAVFRLDGEALVGTAHDSGW